jgi:hypothetical protein
MKKSISKYRPNNKNLNEYAAVSLYRLTAVLVPVSKKEQYPALKICYYQRGYNCLRKTINIEWRINQMTYLRKTNAVIAVMVIMLVGFCSVINVDAASVRLSKTSVSLEAGETVNLSVKGTGKKVSWSSSNKKVATVSKKGKVKALKKGSANIYARVGGKKLTCKVKVKALPMSKYWTADSQAAAHLRAYVKNVTNKKDKENYIPVEDRIAVFDMDGTLTCEQYYTYYDTMMFLQYCLKDHPERVSEELKEAAREIKPGYKAGEALARNFAKSCGVTDAVLAELGGFKEDFKLQTKAINGIDKKTLNLLKLYASGKLPANFLEVMSCPGGCVNGPCSLKK